MYELDEKEFPLQMRFKATAGTLNKYLGTYSLAMYEAFGDEGIKVISKIWSDMADKFFPVSFEKLGFKGKGPKDIAEWFAKADAIVGYPTEFFVVSEKKAGFRITKCPWFSKFPFEGGEKICGTGVTSFEKRATQLLNPKMKFSQSKSFHKGDDVCEFIFELPEE